MFYGHEDIVLSEFSVLFNRNNPKMRGPYKDEGRMIVPDQLSKPSDLTIDIIESMDAIRIKGDDGHVYWRKQGKFEIDKPGKTFRVP